MISSDPYLPVPTIKRDENSLPPITSEVSMDLLLLPCSATHRSNHFHAVPVLEPDRLELLAARDLPVHGDGRELALHAERGEQALDAEAVRHLHHLAVDRDLHRPSGGSNEPVAEKQNDRAHKAGAAVSRAPCSLRWDYPDQVRGVPGRTRFSGILPPRRRSEYTTDAHLEPERESARGPACFTPDLARLA